jgi:rhodanese-related sulfurtransferase
MRVPRAVAGEVGLFEVDATWGVIQPLKLDARVETVGELELREHARAGALLVDVRLRRYLGGGTIPGAVNIPRAEIVERRDELGDGVVVVFCNGPQCPASGQAIAALLSVGWPAGSLRYYRGGIHDWVTLGLPLAPTVPAPPRAPASVAR